MAFSRASEIDIDKTSDQRSNRIVFLRSDDETQEEIDNRKRLSVNTFAVSDVSRSNKLKDEDFSATVSMIEGETSVQDFMVINTGLVTTLQSQIGLMPETEDLINPNNILCSDLLTKMFSSVARFASEELKIIGARYAQENMNPQCNLQNLSLQDKCTKPLFELHDYPTYLLGQDEMAYSLYKFHLDRCLIEKMLMDMSRELLRKKSYEAFLQVLNKILTLTEEEDDYLREAFDRQSEIVNTARMGCEEKQFNQNDMIDLSKELTFYKNQLDDLKKENYVKAQYIDKWEKSRNRQNHVMCRQRLEKIEREIKEYQSKIDRENRVHMEVEKYTQMVYVDTQKELVAWAERYDTEIEEKELKIQSVKEKTQDMSEKLEAFKIKYEEQVKFIEEERKHRAERIRRQKILANKEVAAVKIQAWWRGVRVRRGISQLKKKKNKRAGKKTDAKTVATAKKSAGKGKAKK